MDFRKKLKIRLYIAITYIALGIIMIAATFITKTANDFVSSFGFALAVIGVVRFRNYLIVTKDEETLERQKIRESDERNVYISNRARSTAFYIYLLISCLAVIVLSFCELHEASKWISLSMGLLLIIYWICYFVCRKKS